MQYFFSVQGRMSRLVYWKLTLLVSLVNAALLVAGIFTAMFAGWAAAPFFTAMAAVVAVSLGMNIRRLHDRGRSGWWMLLFFGPLVLASLWMEAAYDQLTTGEAIALSLVYCIGLGLWIWGVIEIWFRAGKRGENQFGPDRADSPVSGWLGRYLGSA